MTTLWFPADQAALTSAYPILGVPHPPTADTAPSPMEPATVTRAAIAHTTARAGEWTGS
jgi:hypothetical protein